MGSSNGGMTALEIAIRHPQPLAAAYLKANPDRQGLRAMFDNDRARMLAFRDFRDSAIRAIEAPALILDGDEDVVLPEHALGLSHLMPQARLVILPGGHGEYLGEVCKRNPHSKIPALTVAAIEEFLDAFAVH
jgi:pimeloyl-ACP methyl ester carboxylesterase